MWAFDVFSAVWGVLTGWGDRFPIANEGPGLTNDG